jgi:sulfur transfer protein SufE
MTSIDEIVQNFELLDQWDDRYRYVIELGRTLSPLPEAAYTEANKVRGCASQVWLLTHVKPDGGAGPSLSFEGDSDAHIVKGLIAILFALYCGKHARPVRPHRVARKSDAAAFERSARDGRTHPRRSESRAGTGLKIWQHFASRVPSTPASFPRLV